MLKNRLDLVANDKRGGNQFFLQQGFTMHMKLTLLRGFQVVGEGTLTLYPQVVNIVGPSEEKEKQARAEQIAKWMLAVEMAVNANGPATYVLGSYRQGTNNEQGTSSVKRLAAFYRCKFYCGAL